MTTHDTILGIDLGTTFSLVAVCDDAGPRILRDEAGEGRVPSVIGFSPGGHINLGWEARSHAVENAEHTVYSIKRLMGLGMKDVERELLFLPYHVVGAQRDTVAVEIDGRLLTPQELSAMILRELRRRAEKSLGRSVRRAVITVPAYFDDSQRQATRDAGRIAGLEVVRIINEPTAAALAYGIGAGRLPLDTSKSAVLPIGDKSKCTGTTTGITDDAIQTIAVYDLGGGTFDVSILRLSDGVFEVLSTHGDTHLGGDDFDRCIVELVQREVKHQHGVEIDAPATRQALRLFAEEVKIRLSQEFSATIELDIGGNHHYQRTLARAEFESLIEPFVSRTISSCRRAVNDAGLQPLQIQRVVLVGGSSRIPLVRRQVQEYFGSLPYTALNPDEVVALGAAVQGQILSGGRSDALLLDVTPLSLGIETMGGAMGKLIMRNTRIPCQAQEQFTTFVDGQTSVKVNVLQGEREMAADCRSLASFDLRGIPPMPAGLPKINVQFLIDTNGILIVSAREERSGVEASVQVIPTHGLTREEVARIEAESIRHAREDMTAHRLIDLRNQVEFDTHKTEQTLTRFGHLLSHARRTELESAMRELRELAAHTQDCEHLYQELENFGRNTIDLANLAITQALKEADAPSDEGSKVAT